MRWRAPALAVLLACLSSLPCAAGAEAPVRVGSKNFNEGYILAEMVSQVLEDAGFRVERKFGLGGTLICYQALVNDGIDLYVEYTGTLSQAVLDAPQARSVAEINVLLAGDGVELLEPFGFNNTYAIAIKRELARKLDIASIGDIARHPELDVVVSHEFLERADGWPGLAQAYGLNGKVTGIEHGLAYQAIENGAIDVTDAYSTDGELERYDLKVLADDRHFFPEYLAAPLVRRDLPDAARQALSSLANLIDDTQMQHLNAEVVFAGRSFADVANTFLASRGLVQQRDLDGEMWRSLAANTLRHLQLTGIALGLAVVVGVGASLAVFRLPVASRMLTYVCGLLQTIPSIALLALMIPLFGIGPVPAVVALFLYSLLPILRNALTALTTIDPTLVRVAVAMGLAPGEQLRLVYVPLALPSMFAGVRTAAVISIGTATLAAFIGAGGLGEPIVTGLALNDVNLILQGAIPAALLAVATELLFEGLERLMLPGHLRGADQSLAR